MKLVLPVLAALGTVALLAPTRGDGPVTPNDVQPTDTITVEIVADADSIRAEPDVVTVHPGQVVRWTSELGEWRVQFQSSVPFGEGAVSEGVRGDRGQARARAVRADAAPGRYKYDIMVRIQGQRTLRADPEVVVAPPGSRDP